ncbi:MAG: hypothetical protein ACTSRP_02145 [Candidatus Helarchaeota archaeon]
MNKDIRIVISRYPNTATWSLMVSEVKKKEDKEAVNKVVKEGKEKIISIQEFRYPEIRSAVSLALQLIKHFEEPIEIYNEPQEAII